jgi:hypothetical protein
MKIAVSLLQKKKSIDKGGRGVASEYHCSRLYDVHIARMFIKQNRTNIMAAYFRKKKQILDDSAKYYCMMTL